MSVRVRFPPEAQEGRLPPSLLCYCPSPQPLPQDRIAAGNHAGRTRAALPVQFFPVFSTEHLWGRRYFRKTKNVKPTLHLIHELIASFLEYNVKEFLL